MKMKIFIPFSPIFIHKNTYFPIKYKINSIFIAKFYEIVEKFLIKEEINAKKYEKICFFIFPFLKLFLFRFGCFLKKSYI